MIFGTICKGYCLNVKVQAIILPFQVSLKKSRISSLLASRRYVNFMNIYGVKDVEEFNTLFSYIEKLPNKEITGKL